MEPKHTKFNPAILSKNLKLIIPPFSRSRNLIDGTIEILTKWRLGNLTHLEISHENITERANIEQIQRALEDVLFNSHRFRKLYTGTQKFYIVVVNRFVKSVYREEGNYLLRDIRPDDEWKIN